jgi:hypothetical protein
MKYFFLFILIAIGFDGFAQDTSRYQLEFSGAGFLYHDKLCLHYGFGVNLPTVRPRVLNTIELNATKVDGTNYEVALRNFYTLTFGKSFQYTKKHFFATVGLGMGPYYKDDLYYNYNMRQVGLAILPRGEIGWNGKKVAITAGLYFGMGAGYLRKTYKSEVIEKGNWFNLTGGASPYLKIILK